MSAGAQTRIFGVKVGLDPKLLVGALIAVAMFLFWYNSRSEDSPAGIPPGTRADVAPGAPVSPLTNPGRHSIGRRRVAADDRGTLRFRTVNGSNGDVDPELRLDLLARLHNVKAAGSLRNIFETGSAVAPGAAAGNVPTRIVPVKQPMMQPPAVGGPFGGGPGITVNIPYKYYGFAKAVEGGGPNRGFFLKGDDILVASEGDLLEQHYLVVQLGPTSARLEDTQLKMGQTLPVVPEAQEQQ